MGKWKDLTERAKLGNVLLRNHETYDHVDVTLTRTTFLNSAADQVSSFRTFICCSGNVCEDTTKSYEFKVKTWLPNHPDLSPTERL